VDPNKKKILHLPVKTVKGLEVLFLSEAETIDCPDLNPSPGENTYYSTDKSLFLT
jgi:hypothetical protein